jgi:AAA+ ATPase superfamily predicted ATPase
MNTPERKSPFKFLDPYNKADKDFFFGREDEVRLLYDFVNKNRIVLVYGQSGTGKTSIIQCGLANEFDTTDWNPFYIRRGDNLNESLAIAITNEEIACNEEEVQNLATVLFSESTDIKNTQKKDTITYTPDEKIFIAGLICNLQKITERYMRPVYLIFDQFEELLILAPEE